MADKNDSNTKPEKIANLTEPRRVFSEKLLEAYRASGQTAESVAVITRISPEIVLALNEGRFDDLPGKIFGRGFVKNICRVIQADTATFLSLYDMCWESGRESRLEISAPKSQFRLFGRSKDRYSGGVLRKTRVSQFFKGKSIFSFPFSRAFVITMSGVLGISSFVFVYISNKSLTPQSVSFSTERNKDLAEPRTHDNDSFIGNSAGASRAHSKISSKDRDSTVSVVRDEAGQKKKSNLQSQSEQTSQQLNGSAETEGLSVTDGASNGSSRQLNLDAEARSRSSKRQNRRLEVGGAAPKKRPDYQTLRLLVKSPVKIRKKIDDGTIEVKEFLPDEYVFTVFDKADFLIYDAASVEFQFNGRNLGKLGQKGRIRRLVFVNSAPGTL